ncbi:hypothetical protein RJ640_026921 [Escallonia rubra]|uniref:NLP1-9 GAF domain-containing protein n=1 Tax=Escallonia rubra TaxID=112253 RepID=A0AA88UDF5_9ASTE|nr:hypothetical protein RJ640_026921 [Escallonia rubra]
MHSAGCGNSKQSEERPLPFQNLERSPLRFMRWRLIMDSGAFAPNIVLRSLPDNTMDYDLMDELVYDGFWLETTDGFGFWQPGLSTSSTSNFNPGIFPYCETEMSNLIPTLHDGCYKEEAEGPDFLDNPTLVHPQIEKLAENEEHDGEVIQTAPYSSQFESFLVEPGATPSPTSSLRKRLIKAIEYLKESTRNRDILIQMWVPMNRGGRHVLTTNNQPFSVNENCKSLAKYRDVCRSYQFAAEEDSKELVGLLSRVFLKMLPEWTPDVRFFRKEEYPRIGYARQYNVSGSVALPLFEEGSGTCLGVVEIVTTTQNFSYRPEFENVLKALEAVNLRSSGILYPPKMKDCDESYKAALAEIKEVLKSVCNMHKLPLTQTWAPCTQQGKCGCQNSDQNRARCISIVDSACYVPNEQLLGFHEACSEHHLLGGEGVSGGAFITNQQCFSTDISAFSKTEYPLSHHARMFGLRAAVAIRLRSIYTGSADFVLEFFLPVDWKDSKEQKNMLSSLSSVIQQVSQSLRLVTDQELAEENLLPGRETFAPVGYRFEEDDIPTLVLSPSREAARDEPSWIAHMVEAQRKGLGTAVSLGYHKTEPVDGFKVTTHWDYNEPDWRAFSDHKQYQQDSGRKGIVEGRSAGERRRTKTEGTINLQVLRQYFSGSLKDAAKNIGGRATTH